MTNRTIYQNDGYSKKELIEIIEEIDAEKPNTYRKYNYSYFIGGLVKPDKKSG